MKRAALIGTLVVSLVTGSAALAGPGGHGHGHGHPGERPRAHHPERYDYRPGPHAHGTYRAPARYGAYYRPHGYYTHRWARGERLPVAYYSRPYVITDYYALGLHAPPRGYYWVRVDGDAVLAAVATGIVLDAVFHIFN